MAENIDLTFVSKQLDRVLNEQANMRDSIEVLTAMVMRLESGQLSMTTELRALHRQMARFNDRLSKVED